MARHVHFFLFLLGCEPSKGADTSAPEATEEEDSGAVGSTDTGDGPEDTGTPSWADADRDGYPASLDCDDGDGSVHPGAEEVWYDGTDQDCDGRDDDQDGDGWMIADDCDDLDAGVHPGASEEPGDGLDQDCDGVDTADLGALGEGDLLLSEIMNNPSAASDDYGEWIEIYNASGAPVDLEGLTVSAEDAAMSFAVEGGLVVAAGGYVVLARDSDPAVNGGVDWDYDYRSDFALDNGAETLTLSFGEITFDAVSYDEEAWFPDSGGRSMSLDVDHLDATHNDLGQYWCPAVSVYGDGDSGTPGYANDACSGLNDDDGDGWVSARDCDDTNASVYPSAPEIARDGLDYDCDGADGDASDLDVGDLLLTEIMQNPEAVTDGQGEWIELYNSSPYSWNLAGLVVTDAMGTETVTVEADLVVLSHTYVVFAVDEDPDDNGGILEVDYEYSFEAMELDNGADDLRLLPSAGASTVIDAVAWDNGLTFPDPAGASMSLRPSDYGETTNDSGSAWCVATSYIGGDALRDLGTPGGANDGC